MSADLVPNTFETDGGHVRWGAWGEGPPIVLVHGSPFSSSEWREVVSGLTSTYRVYVWDLLGYGQSDKREDQDVSLRNQARIFGLLLKEWGLEQPSVVAHDVGGLVALRALLVERTRFGELTLVNAVGVTDWSGGAFFDLVRTHPDVFAALPAYAHRALAASKIVDASYRGLHPGVLDELLKPWTGEQGQAAFYRQYAQVDDTDTIEIQDQLSDIRIPVRILWGREDTWLQHEYAERMQAAIPHTQFSWIPEAGHVAALDAPTRLVAHLLRPVPAEAA